MAPKLFRVIVPVRGIDVAGRFYSLVLGSPGARVSPGRHYFDCEGTILACFDPSADGDGYEARPLPEPVYLAVDDLEAAFAAVREGGGVLSRERLGDASMGEIATRPWGERSFYAEDPSGNPLCFVDRETVFTGP